MGTTGSQKMWVKVVQAFREPYVPSGLPAKYFKEADKHLLVQNCSLFQKTAESADCF